MPRPTAKHPRAQALIQRAALIGGLPTQIARLTWRPPHLAAYRERRLRDLIAHAQARSPFHRERLRDVDPATFTASDLRRLPVMTKTDVLDHWGDLVTDPRLTIEGVLRHLATDPDTPLLGRYHAFSTGGTSGKTGIFVHEQRVWTGLLLGFERALVRARLRSATRFDRPRVASVVADSTAHVSAAIAAAFETRLWPAVRLSAALPLREIVERLNAAEPSILSTYASLLTELVHEADAGRLTIRPTWVVSTADPLLASTRAALEDRWGAGVLNVWSTTEVGPLAMGCGEGDGLHVLEDRVILERVDEKLRPVADDAPAARVLVTSLVHRTMPLIRYVLEDEISWLDGACPCGGTHRRIADVVGRVDEVLAWGDVRVHPNVFRERLAEIFALRGFQVRQTPNGVDVDLEVEGDVDVDALIDAWTADLTTHGIPGPVVVRVRKVASLPRGTGHKVRSYVPLEP